MWIVQLAVGVVLHADAHPLDVSIYQFTVSADTTFIDDNGTRKRYWQVKGTRCADLPTARLHVRQLISSHPIERASGKMNLSKPADDMLVDDIIANRRSVHYTAGSSVTLNVGTTNVADRFAEDIHMDVCGDFLDGKLMLGDVGPIDVNSLLLQNRSSAKVHDVSHKSGLSEESTLIGNGWRLQVVRTKADSLLRAYSITQSEPGKEYEKYATDVEDVEYADPQRPSIATSGRLHTAITSKPEQEGLVGLRSSDNLTLQRREFALNPEKFPDWAFGVGHIPNGSQVFVADNLKSGIRYTWKNGDVVPAINVEQIKRLQRESAAVAKREANPIDALAVVPSIHANGAGTSWWMKGLLPAAAAAAVLVAWYLGAKFLSSRRVK